MESRMTAELAPYLAEAAEACREAVAAYVADYAVDLRLRRQIVFALGALSGAAARPVLEPVDIELARVSAADAAAVCRTCEPKPALVELARTLQDVVARCDAALGVAPADGGWIRFSFREGDVEVSRDGHLWHARTERRSAENVLLDLALEDVVRLPARHVTAMAVQILDWFERGAAA
jgi:hypothetical protein